MNSLQHSFSHDSSRSISHCPIYLAIRRKDLTCLMTDAWGHDSEVPSLFSRDSSLLQARCPCSKPLRSLMLRPPAPQASSKLNEERLNEEEMAKVCCTADKLGGWICTGFTLAMAGWVPLMEGWLGGAYPPTHPPTQSASMISSIHPLIVFAPFRVSSTAPVLTAPTFPGASNAYTFGKIALETSPNQTVGRTRTRSTFFSAILLDR